MPKKSFPASASDQADRAELRKNLVQCGDHRVPQAGSGAAVVAHAERGFHSCLRGGFDFRKRIRNKNNAGERQ
jgi:hypothetical protein